MYNFGEIVTQVAEMAQRSGDAAYLAKIKAWVNAAQSYAADMYDYWPDLQARHNFTTVDGQYFYYMPSNFDKPYRVYDITNDRKLTVKTLEDYYDATLADTFDNNENTPSVAILYGVSAVSTIDDASFTLQAKSSSSLDNSGIVIRIEAWLDSAKTILGYEEITINTGSPTTYATASSPLTFYGINKIVKSERTTGYITISQVSDSTVLATIPPYAQSSRYPILELRQVPDAAYGIFIPYKKKVEKLVDDQDYPFMDLDDYIILYALAFALHEEKESEMRADTMWKKAEDTLNVKIRNAQTKLGPSYQHEFTSKVAQAHRH